MAPRPSASSGSVHGPPQTRGYHQARGAKRPGSKSTRKPTVHIPSATGPSGRKGSKAKKRQSANASGTTSKVSRQKVTEDRLKELAGKFHETFGYEAKDFQLAAIKAQIEGVDMVVQAPTGSGKTALAAGPHLWDWPEKEKKFTLMVCPLLSLEEEMTQTFELDFGLKAVALNSKNGACSPLVIKDILSHKYQIILLSPEMLQSRTFTDRVLRNNSFMRHLISMFIDEAHCIVHWGADFRKKYGSLGHIRAFLPPGTPVIAVTATLTSRVHRAIISSLHFAQSERDHEFINKGNDRPNVSIIVRACHHPLNAFADLNFVIPPTVRRPSDIPKTYLYVNNITIGSEIIDHLVALLLERFATALGTPSPLPGQPSTLISGIIRPFNATMSAEYRNLAMAHFRAGTIRILVCTDAAGMGCNIPDIKRVVLWKMPPTFSHYIQRAGRAARGRDQTGVAILLVEKSAYSIDLVSKPPPSTDAKDSKKKTSEPPEPKRDAKQVREYALAHGSVRGGSQKLDDAPLGPQPLLNPDSADESLLTLVQSATCRRQVWAEVFNSVLTAPTVPCCDICEPSLLDLARPPPPPPDRKQKNYRRGLPDLNAQDALRKWRKKVYKREHSQAQYDASAILDNNLIASLTSCLAPLTATKISDLIQNKWIFWSKYGAELTELLLAEIKVKVTALPPKPRAGKRGISLVDLILDSEGSKRPRASGNEVRSSTSTPALPSMTTSTSSAQSPQLPIAHPYHIRPSSIPMHSLQPANHIAPLPRAAQPMNSTPPSTSAGFSQFTFATPVHPPSLFLPFSPATPASPSVRSHPAAYYMPPHPQPSARSSNAARAPSRVPLPFQLGAVSRLAPHGYPPPSTSSIGTRMATQAPPSFAASGPSLSTYPSHTSIPENRASAPGQAPMATNTAQMWPPQQLSSSPFPSHYNYPFTTDIASHSVQHPAASVHHSPPLTTSVPTGSTQGGYPSSSSSPPYQYYQP